MVPWKRSVISESTLELFPHGNHAGLHTRYMWAVQFRTIKGSLLSPEYMSQSLNRAKRPKGFPWQKLIDQIPVCGTRSMCLVGHQANA